MPTSTADLGFYRAILAQDPGCAPVRAELAATLLADGAIEDTVAEAGAALAVDPTLLPARLARAEALMRLGRPAEAAEDLLQADRRAPGRARILHALGAAYAELDRLEEAQACLSRAAATDPDDAAVAASLGSVLVRLGRDDAAVAACRRALRLAPGLQEAHQNLAGLLAATDPTRAQAHRDAAYRGRSLVVEPAVHPVRTVLVPSVADIGNVPLRHLLPRTHTTVLRWYVAYAAPDQDRALPPFDLIFNAIGDPDQAPALPETVARLLAAPPCRVLNPPERIARTRRADLPGLLADIPGIVVPEVVRHLPGDPLPTGLLPALVRPPGTHGGEGVCRVGSETELAAALAATDPAYVTRFVPCRDKDGWHRKYRAIFVDRVPYAYHLAIARDWLVHYWTAGMAPDPARRAEEARFLADPASVLGTGGMAALAAIGDRLDLDFAGIDFGVLPDGRLLVFEANATMLVHPEADPRFAYRNPAVRRILDAFEAMLAAAAPSIQPPR